MSKLTSEERCRLANLATWHLKATPFFLLKDNTLWLEWIGRDTEGRPIWKSRKVRICGSHFDYHHRQPWGGNQGAALVILARWIRSGKMELTVGDWERWCGPPVQLGNDEFLAAIKRWKRLRIFADKILRAARWAKE